MTRCLLLWSAALVLCACRSNRKFGDTEAPGFPSAPKVDESGSSGAASSKVRTDSQVPHTDDKGFVVDAAQGGLLEVKASRLALDKGVSSLHQDFAKRMIEDHGKINEELAALARRKGLPAPESLDADHQRALDQLAELDGPTFESAYHAQQIQAHDGAIDLYSRAARECSDADLRAFAEQTLPMLRLHREHLDHKP